jgi:hypothetical protein
MKEKVEVAAEHHRLKVLGTIEDRALTQPNRQDLIANFREQGMTELQAIGALQQVMRELQRRGTGKKEGRKERKAREAREAADRQAAK